MLKALTRRDRFVRLQFTIGPAPVQPKPQLPEKRILRLAMTSAKRGGDPRPSLIEHAAGTHFNAVRIGQADLVFEWNWSYLIAVRGHFSYGGLGPPGSSSTVHGTVITLIVDAATGQVTDSGASNRYPPLARLGKSRPTCAADAARKRPLDFPVRRPGGGGAWRIMRLCFSARGS